LYIILIQKRITKGEEIMVLDKEFIKFLRLLFNHTQQSFSETIGFSKVTVASVERGVRTVTKSYEKAVLNGLGIQEEELYMYRMIFTKIKGSGKSEH
jgi:transcriptional regulator with XRE-family HTH domain